MAPPQGVLTHHVWVQCIMDKADSVRENIICSPKEHKGLDAAFDSHRGRNEMLSIPVTSGRGEKVEYIFVFLTGGRQRTKVRRLLPSFCWSKVTLPFLPIQPDLLDYSNTGSSAFSLIVIHIKSRPGYTPGSHQRWSGCKSLTQTQPLHYFSSRSNTNGAGGQLVEVLLFVIYRPSTSWG